MKPILKLIQGGGEKPPQPKSEALNETLNEIHRLQGCLDGIEAGATHAVGRAMLIKWRRDLRDLRAAIVEEAQ